MNDTVLVITAAVTLALCACALAARYAHAWGVDEGRATPAGEYGRACGGVRLLAGLLAALAAPVLLAAEHAPGLYPALGLCGGLALIGGTAAYAAAFVCTRRGGVRLSKVAGEELGGAAGRVMELLAFFACTALGALMLREGAAACGLMPARQAQPLACASLLGAAAGLAAYLCGGYGAHIRSEGELAPLCMGGAGIAALLCAALHTAKATGAAALLAPHAPLLGGVFALLCVVSALMCLHGAARALEGTFARESVIRRTKKAPFALWMALSLGCMAALALSPVLPLAQVAGALGGIYTLCTLALCALWLRRVGRGLL